MPVLPLSGPVVIQRAVVGQLVNRLWQNDRILPQQLPDLVRGENRILPVFRIQVGGKIAAIMHQTHNLGIGQVLPRPVLSRELTVLGILFRDVVALIIPLEAQILRGQRRAHLHRKIALQPQLIKAFVRRC